MPVFALVVSASSFGVVAWLAWMGRLGVPAFGLVVAGTAAYAAGRRGLAQAAQARLDLVAKALVTVLGMVALLRHPVASGGDAALPVYEAVARYVGQVDGRVFATFAVLAMAIKFVGVLSSAFAWHLLLVGQGIRFPFWSKILTSFLIGRFIGTFIPGTLGLDGYTLYDAGRYSNQWPRAVTAKALEKLVGMTGLFLGMVLTLPFGYQVIRDVTEKTGRPEAAPFLAAAIAAVAGGISIAVVAGLVRPVLLTRIVGASGRLLPSRVRGRVEQFSRAVGAYHGQVGLLLLALASKFVTHFTTAVVYYFTALAIGVTGARFWPITFGSTIQILATVLSPTIAGEGAREAFQMLLLSKHLGGEAQAFLSAALGFAAAEAATLWGGAFIWLRHPAWRPAFALVDGRQVDYLWLDDRR